MFLEQSWKKSVQQLKSSQRNQLKGLHPAAESMEETGKRARMRETKRAKICEIEREREWNVLWERRNLREGKSETH